MAILLDVLADKPLVCCLSDIWEMLYRSPIFWAVVALLVVGGLLYRWRDKLKRAPQPKLAPPPPVVTPLERCLATLGGLTTERLRVQEDFKAFYSTIVEALKLYMDEVRQWTTAEMTSDEVIDLLDAQAGDRQLKERLRKLLREADMSKFAKSCPSLSEAEASLREARLFAQEADKQWGVADQATPPETA